MTTSETPDDVHPRPEARPLKWDELTEDQQLAAKHASQLLSQLAEHKWTPPPETRSGVDLFLPPIYRDHVNHVVLLDGGRGTGKTALLITLLDWWSWGVRKDAGIASEEDAPPKDMVDHLGKPGKVVPVGLVDLQPLPTSTNLLLHLVGRFLGVVEAIEQSCGSEGARPPWHAAGDDEPKCRTRWREFLRAVTTGWNHGLEGRRANLDPEAYTIEVEQAERRRLHVVSSFRRFVDALVEDFRKFQHKPKDWNPLFVMAIDDADMNLGRSVELLDLVRALWHPRVAFVLTGESDLFRETLRVHELGLLCAPLRGVSGLEMGEQYRPGNGVHGRVAEEIYAKAIPPGHRHLLRPLEPAARHKRIKRILPKKAKDAPSTTRILAIFEDYADLYNAIPGILRHLVDFEQWISTLAMSTPSSDKEPLEAQLLRHLWDTAIRDTQNPTPIVEHIKPWLSWDTLEPHKGITLHIRDSLKFEVLPDVWMSRQIAGIGTVSIGSGLRVHSLIGTNTTLPVGLAGCLQFALDLGQIGKGVQLAHQYNYSPEARSILMLDVPTSRGLLKIGWALPHWLQFSKYASILRQWSAQATTSSNSIDMVKLAQCYINAVLGEPADPARESTASDWTALAGRVAKIAIGGEPHGQADPSILPWAQTIVNLLAAPESGLPADAANAWLETIREVWTEHDMWDVMRTSLSNARAQRVQAAEELTGIVQIDQETETTPRTAKTLRELDQRWPEHAWRAIVDIEPRAVYANFIKKVRNIGVSSYRSGSLSNYISTFREKELMSAPPELIDRMSSRLRFLAKQHGTTGGPAIEMLWKVVTDNPEEPFPELRDLIYFDGQVRIMSPSQILKKIGKPTLNKCSVGNIILDRRREDKFGLGLGHACFQWAGREGTGRPIHAIYRMAWDVFADASVRANASKISESPLAPWWTVAGGLLSRTGAPIPWPAAAWPTFIDWEGIANAWNSVVMRDLPELARQAAREDGNIDIYGDAAAFWFVRATAHYATSRCDLSDIPFEISPNGERWRFWLASEYSERTSENPHLNPHAKVVREWFDRVGLLAAPESGLSLDVAEGILAAIPNLAQRRQKLIQWRKERLKFIGFSPVRIERQIRGFNKQFPNHPWTLQIENPARSKDSPPDAPAT